MKIFYKSLFLVGLFCAPLAFADEAPVVAATPSDSQGAPPNLQQNNPSSAVSSTAIDTSGMSLEERVTILERQMAAANQINLMNQVNNLQQQLQELQGQTEELSHTLQTLQTQSTSQYADLDQRLRKLEGGGQAAGTGGANTPQAGVATTGASTTSGQNQTISAEQSYQSAYDKVKSGNYTDGIAAMQKFLTQYPNSTYVSNAHYWIGQMYLLKGDGKSAAKEFEVVINQYPQDQKAKDAALKLGFAYLLQNKTAEAKVQFKKVMRLYPGSSTAQLAEARLAQMP